MTPEIMQDIRDCAEFAYGYGGKMTEAGARVLAWLDEQERMHTPIVPMDADDLDCEYTWLDFAGSV